MEALVTPMRMVIAFCGLVWVFVVLICIAKRYVKVGPNQALIISGRRVRLPDGRSSTGFRIVKGGGTLVVPVIEKVDVLSLNVVPLEMPKVQVRTDQGYPAELDCLAQFKIKSDYESIAVAAEQLLSKNEAAIQATVQPIIERHLRITAANVSVDEIRQSLDAFADKVQAAASADLNKLGIAMVSLSVRDTRANA